MVVVDCCRLRKTRAVNKSNPIEIMLLLFSVGLQLMASGSRLLVGNTQHTNAIYLSVSVMCVYSSAYLSFNIRIQIADQRPTFSESNCLRYTACDSPTWIAYTNNYLFVSRTHRVLGWMLLVLRSVTAKTNKRCAKTHTYIQQHMLACEFGQCAVYDVRDSICYCVKCSWRASSTHN